MHSLLLTKYRYISLPALQIIIGVLALFASAQIGIPLKPVPVTIHTSIVTLIALTYNPKLTFITISSYILAGVVGLPMFSKLNSGFAYLCGPTGGYIIGFLMAGQTMSLLKDKLPNNFRSSLICGLIGMIIIYCAGVYWLSTFIGFEKALYQGMLIFIPTGLAKLFIQSFLINYVKQNAF